MSVVNCDTLVCNLSSTPDPRGMRRALRQGRTVVLLSKRDKDVTQVLSALSDPALVAVSGRMGDGRTATMLSTVGIPKPFAYWLREHPQPVWRRACRACGAVDERWSWGEDGAGRGQAFAPSIGELGELVEVPWACPRSSKCHGAPRWLLSL